MRSKCDIIEALLSLRFKLVIYSSSSFTAAAAAAAANAGIILVMI